MEEMQFKVNKSYLKNEHLKSQFNSLYKEGGNILDTYIYAKQDFTPYTWKKIEKYPKRIQKYVSK